MAELCSNPIRLLFRVKTGKIDFSGKTKLAQRIVDKKEKKTTRRKKERKEQSRKKRVRDSKG